MSKSKSGPHAGLKNEFHEHVMALQDAITAQLRACDPGLQLIEDPWKREALDGGDGGGGRTRAFSGEIIENAGVNISQVYGKADPEFLKRMGGDGSAEMWACGISLIIHPRNPRVPTVHANFRLIEVGEKIWFGGGADLTPFYPQEEDFRYFHEVWKKACAPYGCYAQMKEECDRYFVNTHRGGEMRGIGGIFFDHYNTGDLKKDAQMVKDLSESFIPSYFPIVKKRLNDKWSAEDEDFQLHRRGRYVEFNLLHDRGTLFGLRTNGRTDSILISLPGRCKYTYKYAPTAPEHVRMMEYYRPKDW